MQVGVAGHEDVAVTLALLLQGAEQAAHGLGHAAQAVAGEELEVEQHLVVARTAGMDFLPHVAEAAGEHQLYLGMDIFYAVFDDEIPFLGLPVDVLEFAQQLRQFVVGNEADAVEHGDVCHGTHDIVGRKIEVKLTVVAHGKTVYLIGHLYRLFP